MNFSVLMFSLVAGVVGTGLGGVIGTILKRCSSIMGKVLAFAGGIMMGVVAYEMIPEAIFSSLSIGKAGAIAAVVGAIVAGIVLVWLLDKLIGAIEKRKRPSIKPSRADKEPKSKSLIKTGIIMLLAIAFHNLPEGMAIGASGAAEVRVGLIVAIVIAIHNIPEGMAIAAPLASGGMRAPIVILLTLLAGASTVVGAIIGLSIGGISETATGLCLALASGAMLYVTFLKILPEATALNKQEIPAGSMLVGLICSIIFVFAF